MRGTVTSLVAAGHNGDRVDVYVDGEWAVRVSQTQLISAGLYTGLRLTASQWSDLLDTAAEENAYNRALNYLSYRPRSSREIAQNLQSRGIDHQVVGRVLERLEKAGFLDDEQFAEFWIANRGQFSPRGKRALKQELFQKGLSREVIERSLEDLPDQVELAQRAARRRLRSVESCDRATFHNKLLGFLNRRGFDYQASREAVDRLWSERETEQR
jgi:regulatory protein